MKTRILLCILFDCGKGLTPETAPTFGAQELKYNPNLKLALETVSNATPILASLVGSKIPLADARPN